MPFLKRKNGFVALYLCPKKETNYDIEAIRSFVGG